MTKPDSPTTAAAPYGEAERQAAELAALRRMIEASRGCFSLSVAVCNSPALRDYVIREACESFPAARMVSVPAGTVDVFEFVAEGAEASPPAALFLVDLEASIPSDRDSQPTLRSLNASRELWQRRFPCPVVLWLPEYAAGLMSIHARDLWRYRSHRFEFVPEQLADLPGTADQITGGLGAAAALTAEEKRFRIAELEQRIAEVGEEPPNGVARHTAVWLNELGFLYEFIGDLGPAEQMFRKALEINEKLGRPGAVASGYGNLGLIYQTRGDLDRAEQMLRKSLEINEKLRRQEGMAIGYGNLGVIYQIRGDLERAEQMFRKSLEIDEKLGGQEGMASQYGNLGVIYLTRGDLDRAEQMYRKALEIDEKLGRLKGMAVQYGNLGLIYRTRGDLDRAEQMHRKALEIDEKLGRLEGMASQYGNLGVVYQTRGDLDRAEQMHRKALEIDEQLGGLEGMASQYGNVGALYWTRGDLDGAEEMLRKSLEINEKLGRLEGMANAYANLGAVAEQRGDTAQARKLWTKARGLYERIGMPHMVQRVQGWLDELPGEPGA